MSQKINNFYKNYFIELAFKLAKINLYKTNKNPSVGCVVTDFNNNILSTGFTSIGGRPHAETNALLGISKNKRKKVFVTLEPCSHYGKTPPCVKTINKKKVKEVYFAHFDKNPLVYKNGFNYLKKNKIITILNKKICKNFYKKYDYSLKNQIPFVSVKLAITKNFNTSVIGKKYFTNNKSLKFSHLLRYQNDSILVGKNTFLNDYPKLNCRIVGLENFSPKIFVINNNLIFTKKHYNLFSKKIFIIHSSNNLKKILKFKKYFHLLKLKSTEGIICPNDILKTMYKLGSRRLLIEGGLKTIELFNNRKLINKYYFIQSNLNFKKTKDSARFFVNDIFKKSFSKHIRDINLDDNKLFIK